MPVKLSNLASIVKECLGPFWFQIVLVKVFILGVLCPLYTYALTAEQVLGEYWNDPLFGQAAAEHTVELEVLHRRIWPMEVTVPSEKNIRFIVKNKTEEMHLLAFTKQPERLIADEHFKMFVNDELHHARQSSAAHHHDHHSDGAADKTQDIVKTLDQNPTVLVRNNEEKEILISFSDVGELYVFCVLDEHQKKGYVSKVLIEKNAAP